MTVKGILLIEGLVNLLMVITKLTIGILTGSAVIVADALHSFTDLINNLVAFLAIRVSQKPADEDHHYGHQKFEQLAVFFLATLLCVVAIEVTISAISRSSTTVEQSTWGLVALVVVIGINLALSLWQRYWANRLKSEILHADASHTFSDVLTSIAAIAGWQLAAYGLYWIDTVFAVLVAILICVLAYRLFSKAVPILVDQSPYNPSLIRDKISKIPQVETVQQMRTRSIGDRHFADVTITVDPSMSLVASHAIADDIETMLARKFDIQDVTVHVEPKSDSVSSDS